MSEENPTAKEIFAGSNVEIDASGDYIIDTREALGGDVRLRLSQGRALKIEIAGAPVLEVSNDGGQIKIDLGGRASERLVLGDAFKALFNDFLQSYVAHTHPTSMGPSGPPTPPFTQQMTDDQLSDVARTKKR